VNYSEKKCKYKDLEIMKTNTQLESNVNEAKYQTRRAATSPWMIMLARLGYTVKGVVYLIIGWLALMLAIGYGGKATDQNGAIHTINALPFGKFLLAVVAIGLLGFALWSFIQAIFDTEGKGRDAKGIVGRIGFAVVGLSYGILAFVTFQIVIGSGNGGKSSSTNTQDWTAQLLKQPFGQALVVLVGIVVLVVAGYLFYGAYSAKFQSRLNLTDLRAQMKRLVVNVGRFGYAALGVVFTIIGIFLMVAAFQHNAKQAVGLDGALQELARQPFGPFLLGIVALGLIAYGIYSLVEARYRRLGR
jgi:Domain of Unknown Function (DUF1206)